MTNKFLRRYTNIPALIYLLKNQSLTLLNPKSWDDTNDSYALQVYKNKRNLKTVLALCFTETVETYHHWHVFAGGAGGACITFNRRNLLRALDEYVGVKHKGVLYRKLDEMNDGSVLVDQLPFIKRSGFQDEREFRVIYENKSETFQTIDIPVPLTTIERIHLSPWLPKALADDTKFALNSIAGCADLQIFRSTLVGNQRWKRVVSNAA
ncbi:DUF2971 domain-containing protein [Paraburkholderia sp.]|uniref:DUF2971 domain-containing protein n=1 Tax=Paraburkholderia sp. TaxID=1926495 RepID=UPI003C73F5DF